ncbi:SDR family oxidoreductase [Dactylosporangium roseum]|uniref:SDR family oxidoreductase n=1 Tax=Dactylosporangium roseum TaxID=47989 RepID=A0ABY5ZD35_9ACTN|nr:SDR family oxidoreductase [Dactylosporangium roseum]UWZ39574.1 SDR family oxidoreductase [Dactylosporangium roseum]
MTAPVAVVTGGTRGIGLALSARLVKLGYRVVACFRSDAAAADAAAAELGPQFVTVPLDVADAAAVAAVGARLVRQYGAPRVLVNNAGVNVDRPFLSMTAEEWSRVVDVNLSGAFHVTRAFAPSMVDAAGGGVIVNVGATTGIRPRRNGVNYCASKAGLLHLTKCLALELAPRVRVNALIPGMTETDELVARFGLDDWRRREAVLAEIPAARLGTTEDIADGLEYLVGAGGSYLTGQKLVIDGGQFMW